MLNRASFLPCLKIFQITNNKERKEQKDKRKEKKKTELFDTIHAFELLYKPT